MKTMFRFAILSWLTALSAHALAADTDWIEKSNGYTRKVLALDAKYVPEQASFVGVESADTEVADLKPGAYQRYVADLEQMLAELRQDLQSETDPRVKQDLQILVTAVSDNIESQKVNRKYMLPFTNLGENIFQGLQIVLDPRNSPERQSNAVERLKKYAGLSFGTQPITELARAQTMERMDTPNLTGPYVEELKKSAKNTETYITGIAEMFRAAKLKGWEEAHGRLAEQLRGYDKWIEEVVMPRARTDNRLPEPVYTDNLKNFGVTMNPRELLRRAQTSFAEIRDEMQVIAGLVARERKLPSADYRDVMRELKKQQISGADIMPFYKERLRALEDIIRTHDLVTLPARDSIIRLASEAESAASPAPHMNPPRLIGNQGEFGEFVLPLRNPNADSKEIMDDFTNESYAWTLTAHESRPGHELQFSAMVENGVSLARAIYAFNSANAEGWGLYSEALVKEYLPLDGQLFSLQSRGLRAARAFLDPMLNLGMMKPEQAKAFLMEELAFSDPFSTQEVDRYTYRAPGQATSYYVGYINLRSMRIEAELALGKSFDQRAFHDFILNQGLLPPALLRKAVMEEFVGVKS